MAELRPPSKRKKARILRVDGRRKLIEGAAPAASLTKALDQSELVKNIVEECAEDLSAVNTAVVNAALKVEVKERHALEDQLRALTEQSEADRHAAFHDPLTGCPNRALFNDRLEQGFAQAGRHRWTLAVMFLDLNNFKSINDVHGHETGDTVLQIIADRLRKMTRRDDTICRHGGDEFLYLLAEISEEADAIRIAKKLIAAIEEPCLIELGDTPITVVIGASIGIAFFPKHGIDAESLLRQADAAMYEAKRSQSGYSIAPSSAAA